MDFSGLMKSFRKTKVLVVGDLILDRYIWGKVNRISPEAPVPVVEVTNDDFMLGGAANVAHNVITLGGQATVAGIIGSDRAGDVLQKLLEERGIDSALVEDSRPTTMKTRVIAHNQQVVRFDKEDKANVGGRTLRSVIAILTRCMRDYDAVIVSDYRKGMVSSGLIREILRITKPLKRFVAVDPKIGHFHCYKGVSLVTPNLAEASQGSGMEISNEPSLVKAGHLLLKKLACSAVLITRGDEGMSLFEKGRVTHIPTMAKHVYDVTGAGDTVIATFTLAFAAGATTLEAAVMANHAAGIVVGEVGTAVATPEKLRESLRRARKYPWPRQ